MKKVLKIVAIGLAVVLCLAGAGVITLSLKKPAQRPPAEVKVSAGPAQLARGEYLANHVSACMDCHSQHDWSTWNGEVIPGSLGGGGLCLDQSNGLPGRICSRNLTPDADFGVGQWSDGELMRAFREGVSRDGHALFTMMPYEYFSHMSDDDAAAVVAYLRSLKPVHNKVADTKLDFPVNLFVKFAPHPLTGAVSAPARTDHLKYGEYLVNVAACGNCHTPIDDKGQPLPGMTFAGGFHFKGPWGHVVSANITPDTETGIGSLTKAAFIARFKGYEHLGAVPAGQPGTNTIMPWRFFSGMTEEDLGDIYDYLRTVPAVHHAVNRFPDAK